MFPTMDVDSSRLLALFRSTSPHTCLMPNELGSGLHDQEEASIPVMP